MKKKIRLFDTTLRDGSQGAGISFSADDMLKIAQALDEFGIHYVEGGWPGSNPKHETFFKRAKKELRMKNAKLVAFGSTRYKGNTAANDPNLKAIAASGTNHACIFGKTWDLHVTHALRTTLDENVRMISDSVRYIKSRGMTVIYDAEHFFDGYKSNPGYALKTLEAALDAGSENVTLCDTNGGTLPDEMGKIVCEVVSHFWPLKKAASEGIPLGIHAHNDSGCAVANTLLAVEKGATLVQGTINGLGERCGNANLCSIIPNLQLKMGFECVDPGKLKGLTELSRYVGEVANVSTPASAPYVGESAFTHKAGVHVSAISRLSSTYEHVSPSAVGNERKILVSELAGKSNVMMKVRELNIDFTEDEKTISKITDIIKKMENQGYQFEGADASFALIVKKTLGNYKPCFALKGFRVITQNGPELGTMRSEATIKLSVNNIEEHTAAEGDGPVNALDNALRKALEKFYPELAGMSLSDFKVRVIDAAGGTAAKVKVLIESKDRKETWGTVGVSENIIEASWQALVDAVEYKLLKNANAPPEADRTGQSSKAMAVPGYINRRKGI
jgi:2-isopropylmalate synthase